MLWRPSFVWCLPAFPVTYTTSELSVFRSSPLLMNPLTRFIFELQEISVLIWRSFASLFSSPRYVSEWIKQMDLIGVGSLPIVLLTGFFTGAVLVLQTHPILGGYGVQNSTGQLV